MVEILKYVYNMILFVSLYLLGIYVERECYTYADCRRKYRGANKHLLWCNDGYCEYHTQ
ncbi:putative Late nodulin [Medicago truncatula]|uniref:Nodule Cysteine-Rich (NCR) secreted peptide n=1 Tax=Medicago truncatula TaxID=3880 RepID=G7JPA1_MEDTR|nr:Nodule Cysteine-Rich (NCR) secreted peptide [Medicago truncatula]RHN59791.1 putative Late nodulin [Medicago truncatula]